MVGAIRLSGWVTLSTMFKAANRERFVSWVRRRLAPKLRPNDVVVLDNAQAHKSSEACWPLANKHIRSVARRNAVALRKAAHAGRYRVRPSHCRRLFRHAGYRGPAKPPLVRRVWPRTSTRTGSSSTPTTADRLMVARTPSWQSVCSPTSVRGGAIRTDGQVTRAARQVAYLGSHFGDGVSKRADFSQNRPVCLT